MRLSPNFVLSEFTRSSAAERLGLDNTPSQEHIENLKLLCYHVLQKVRNHYGKPVIVTSGYRSPAVNKAIGGSATSQHSNGEAADIEIMGLSNHDLAVWIRNNLVFDQLILEFFQLGVPNSGWVHVSYKLNNNRRQVLTAVKEGNRTVYKPGLFA
jgi:zinc D-Ala-D-Ala carboxypeptidase